MYFVANGPDIPTSLIRAQRNGDLLFMVGAGVSKSAGLPLFGELADMVYARLGQELPGNPGSLASRAEVQARDNGQYDRLIGLLEQRLVYRGADWRQPHNGVRETVASLVSPGSRARFSAHADLLDLSRDTEGRPRIVTTNFDTIFERSWLQLTGSRLASSAGQGIPAVGSHEFTGVLHLHGRVADRRCRLDGTDLVLTSANFGEAYMRSGWASRIVYDLLRRYTLVLVGYSADDPPMRYMLEATEEGRLHFPDLKPAFALVGDPDNDSGTLREAWRGKGLQPLIYSAADNDHRALYQTLHAWAELAREPLNWSQDQLRRIAATEFGAASTEERAKFAFLATEISSVAVAASQCSDPAWIEALQGAEAGLDDWTYVSWFRNRLESAAAARFAAGATDIVKARIASAVNALLRSQHPPPSAIYQRFWLLFVQANLRPTPNRYGRIRAGQTVTTNLISETTSLLEPTLTLEKRLPWGETEEPDPTNIHDLARFSFRATERDWQRRLERWPQEARAEERLIFSLDRALCEALELGLEAGIVKADGNLMSYDLALVHAPDHGEGLVETLDRHNGSWRLNQPDANNQRCAPLVRMMTGLWRRLAGRDALRAARISSAWGERDAIIFKRLAAWTAVEGEARAFALTEAYLRSTTRTRYWASDKCPEIVRFYCRSWNALGPPTRRAIERAILSGMMPDAIQRIARRGHRRYARALYSVRELARIRTAGGHLSQRAEKQLAAYYHEFPDLPREMPIYAHLYNPSWSGSGYSADISVLDQVDDRELLSRTAAFEQSNRIEQADIWPAFVRNEPERAFAALSDALNRGDFSFQRWSPLLDVYAYENQIYSMTALPDIATIIESMLQVTNAEIAPLVRQLSRIIERHADDLDAEIFSNILSLWDKLFVTVIKFCDADDHEHTLADTFLSHPLASLAGSLVAMQNSLCTGPGKGLAARFIDRFDALACLNGRAGIIARGALLQQMPFLDAIAPDWVAARLLPGLLDETEAAIDLMSAVAQSVAPQQPALFNTLKPAILRALEHERTDAFVREKLSGALIGAAFSIIDGNKGFALSGIECRQTLTRMPNTVLARMAWEVGYLLRERKGDVERAAYWDSAVMPFLRDFWPNDVVARTSEVSENLALLPALAGDAFERAVVQILDLVRPIQRYELSYDLDLDGGRDLISRYPRSVLKLISALLDRKARPPSDLADVVSRLLEADPLIGSDPSFWRLRQMLRAD
ncbi:SIR2 family protein [Novosphingobium sp. AAP1]|uniref:SIR2 family protein n=1 Tax=Novosphingobium sp. AAP1 TaxID=1523413 RepID=UPI0018D05360|nr:SIR2 family protein [Novosphingobium sp. AAP1]